MGGSLLMTEDALVSSQKLWPFLLLCSVYLGVLNCPHYEAGTVDKAAQGVIGFRRAIQFSDANQTAMNDIFAMVFVTLGGGVTLSALAGKFGTLKHDQDLLSFLDYLFSRGSAREVFWVKYGENPD